MLCDGDSGLFISDKSWVWTPVRRHIDEDTASIVRHGRGDVPVISETDGTFGKTVDEFLDLGMPTVTPYIGYVLSFDDRNEIGDVDLTANKIMPCMILDDMVGFFV